MAVHAIEVVYRGIFQKTLSRNICRTIVLAARKEGKIGTAFGRYGDSPERNGIPAKYFAVVADDPTELEESLAQYEPKAVDVSITVDDTLCKGVESWAWYGLQPINALTKENATVLVTSIQSHDELIQDIHQKDVPFNLAIVKGAASFSGLWVYKDDHTDVRILGALANVCPQMVSLASYCEAIMEQWEDEVKVTSARRSYERLTVRRVEPGEGNPAEPYKFDLPGWQGMEEALVIPSLEQGGGFRGGEGGFQPVRSSVFKKFSTRSMRPVVDFETCTKCTLCWLQCPDSCFDVTPEGLYDANMDSCCGCGVCEDVCPVPDCITMVNEEAFTDNSSQHDAYKKDQVAYKQWVQEMIALPMPRAAPMASTIGVSIRRSWLQPKWRDPMTTSTKPEVGEREELISGSEAIARACALADVDVITAYPIRPYDTVMQFVSKLIANGELKCEYIVAESEHSQFEIVKHASAVGARVFAGSSGVGWFYAFEALAVTCGLRLPMVAMVGNRALDDPGAFGCEHNDALAVRDLGWMLNWVATAQEAMDTAFMAWRVAEDPRIFLPCAISTDGAFLTHSQQLSRFPKNGRWIDSCPPTIEASSSSTRITPSPSPPR